MKGQAIAALKGDGPHLCHILFLQLRHQVIEQFELTAVDVVLIIGAIEPVALYHDQEGVLIIIMIGHAVDLTGKLLPDAGIDLLVELTHRHDLRFLSLVTEIIDLIVPFA